MKNESEIETLKCYARNLNGKIERLKKILAPILAFDFGDYHTPWVPLFVDDERIEGAARSADGYVLSLIDGMAFGFKDFIEFANAIGEAKKAYAEFEKYEKGEQTDEEA